MEFKPYFKKLINSFQFILLGLVFVLFLMGYAWFSDTPYFDILSIWAQDNYQQLVIYLIIFKVIGIIWPPLPGVIPILAAIPVIGWLNAFWVDLIGGVIGAMMAFYLARKFGDKVVKKLFGPHLVKQIKKFKFKPNREIEAIVLLKIFGAGIGEFISYGAGLTKINLRNFLIGHLIANVVAGIPLFYYFDFAFSHNNLLYALVPLGAGLVFFYVLRKRYFHWG